MSHRAGRDETLCRPGDGDTNRKMREVATMEASDLLDIIESQGGRDKGTLQVTVSATVPLRDVIAGRGTVELTLDQ